MSDLYYFTDQTWKYHSNVYLIKFTGKHLVSVWDISESIYLFNSAFIIEMMLPSLVNNLPFMIV